MACRRGTVSLLDGQGKSLVWRKDMSIKKLAWAREVGARCRHCVREEGNAQVKLRRATSYGEIDEVGSPFGWA